MKIDIEPNVAEILKDLRLYVEDGYLVLRYDGLGSRACDLTKIPIECIILKEETEGLGKWDSCRWCFGLFDTLSDDDGYCEDCEKNKDDWR